MNLKRFFSKNAFIILVIVILGLFFVFFRKTEGFQEDTMPVSYSYNTSNCFGDYEPVTTNSGNKLCLKKCNKIKANYVTATSDPTICKEMSGTRVVKTVSRNNTSNSCNFPKSVYNGRFTPSTFFPNTSPNRYYGQCVSITTPYTAARRYGNQPQCAGGDYKYVKWDYKTTRDMCYACDIEKREFLDTALLKCFKFA